jgi:hypothetical protein
MSQIINEKKDFDLQMLKNTFHQYCVDSISRALFFSSSRLEKEVHFQQTIAQDHILYRLFIEIQATCAPCE